MAQTLLLQHRESQIEHAVAEGARLWIPLDDLERATGWSVKPEGVCRGEVCVPARGADWLDASGGRLDFAAFAAALGHPAARDEEHGVWAFGPAVGRGLAADSGAVVAPDFRLPDLDGNLRTLAEQRGKKVLLYCWASW
jgi:hypothetical protein